MRILKMLWHSSARIGLVKRAAIVCGTLLAAESAPAAVIYYQPPGRLRLHNFNTAHQHYNIDLNSDGISDLQHNGLGGSAYLRSWGETRFLGLRLPYEGETWYDSEPYALVGSTLIGPDSPALFPQYGSLSGWQSHPMGIPGAASLHVRYGSGTSGFFVGNRGYIGVEFLIENQIHYGWIDLDNYSWWQSEIHGWAYESEPGKPIIAGAIPEPSTLLLACATLGSWLVLRRGRVSPSPFNVP